MPLSSKRNPDPSYAIFNTPFASYGLTAPSSAIPTQTSLAYTVTTHLFGAGYDGFLNTLKSMKILV